MDKRQRAPETDVETLQFHPDRSRALSHRLAGESGTPALIALTCLLWIACLLLCYALLATPVTGDADGLIKLTETRGALERVALWQRTLSWLPGGEADGSFATWPKPMVAWTVRTALSAMYLAHTLAFAVAWRSCSTGVWRWLGGPIGAQLIMLLMAPTNADVFFYAIGGDIANGGMNPYITHLYEVPGHPIYPYNFWVEMTSVYGPVWTLIGQAVMGIAGPDPARAVLAHKIVLGATAVLLAAGVYGAARLLGIARGPATAAMVLVAWQPNMIVESAGQAHNDVVMLTLVLAGVTLAVVGAGRSTRGGFVLVTLSAAVKYVSLPVLGLLALTRLDPRSRDRGLRRILLAWLLDAVAVAVVLVAAFAPYWTDGSILVEMVSEPGRLYTNLLWIVPAEAFRAAGTDVGAAFENVSRIVAQGAAVVATVAILLRFALTVRRSGGADPAPPDTLPAWTRPFLAGWAATFAILAFVPVNVHAWYWTWPVVPVALLIAWDGRDDGSRWPRQRWLAPYLTLTAVLTIVYHTRVVPQ